MGEVWSGQVVRREPLRHSIVLLPVSGSTLHRAVCACGWRSAARRFYDAYADAKQHRESTAWSEATDAEGGPRG